MKRIIFVCILPLLAITCQKESLIQRNLESGKSVLENLSTPESVMTFIQEEMPEFYEVAKLSNLAARLEPEVESSYRRGGKVVEVAAGSIDAIEAAVQEAGVGGTVVLKAGDHVVNGRARIEHRINLIGEDGATLILNHGGTTMLPETMDRGLQLLGASRSIIKNVSFVAGGDIALSALYIYNSDRVVVRENTFHNFELSISVNQSDFVHIAKNKIVGNSTWQTGGPSVLGVTVINGRSANVVDNDISNCVFGIWCCDKGGVSWGNLCYGNLYGQIVCKVPEGSAVDDDGNGIFAEYPGNHWLVAMNRSPNNFYGGIVVIDGANHNVLLANTGGGNGAVDVDLVGDSERFGFFTPTSIKNRVYSFNDQTIKDCGENNIVNGGILVDDATLPCL